MDSSDNRASGGDRRLSTRRSLALSEDSNGSHGEEGYDLAELPVADGFRPTASLGQPPPRASLRPPSSSSIRSQSPAPSHTSASSSRSPPVAPVAAYSPSNALRSRPSSISKAHRAHESLTLRNDGSSATPTSQPIFSQLPALSTGVPLIRTDNTPGTVSGSSHPYHAYESRTLGDTTVPTPDPVREGEYNGPRGPTHPYSLYPQSTAPLEDTSGQHIPVGFTGFGATYQRQYGPDGEEAGDLIGPLGHMEALPPYTRYPEQSFPGSTQAGAPSPSPVAAGDSSAEGSAATTTAGIPGTGGIGITTRNSEYSSTEENLPVTRLARGGNSSDTSQSDSINVATQKFAEQLPSGKWQRRARKKLWGVIPYWAICLLVLGLIVVGVVMGAVLSFLLEDDKKNKPDGDESGATHGPHPTVDVEPLMTLPPGLAPLMTGVYDLPPLDVAQAPRSCFAEPSQSQSWSCEMPLSYYSMVVGMIPNASKVENYEIQLEAINGSNSVYVWGTQPPSITEPMPLRLVNDTFELGRGPAWWRDVPYDKTVLVSDSSFSKLRRRDWTYTGPPRAGFDPTRFMKGNPGPVDGEKAWICTWPNVTMEIFIYPNQNASIAGVTTATSLTPSAALSGAPPEPTKPPYDPTPSYPQVVKFLERRLLMDGDDIAAVCRQVRIIKDGRDSEPVLDDYGEPVKVRVKEKVSSYEESISQQERSRHPDRRSELNRPMVRRETLELTDCGCLWWST